MKRHQYAPGWRSSGEDTCPLCAHRRAGRIARETYRGIQIARRAYVAQQFLRSKAGARWLITRANFQRSKT